jgi:hypothetical protein
MFFNFFIANGPKAGYCAYGLSSPVLNSGDYHVPSDKEQKMNIPLKFPALCAALLAVLVLPGCNADNDTAYDEFGEARVFDEPVRSRAASSPLKNAVQPEFSNETPGSKDASLAQTSVAQRTAKHEGAAKHEVSAAESVPAPRMIEAPAAEPARTRLKVRDAARPRLAQRQARPMIGELNVED